MHLSVSALTIERGGRLVLSGLSFDLSPGEALAVTGPNGAGKSTLLRALAGLLPPTSGRISHAPAREERLAEETHYIGHADALKGTLTVAENLAFWTAMLGGDRPGVRLEEALARFGLAHLAGLPAAYLSAGQRRRLALARLLVAQRPLWLLDEPFNALDAASQVLMTATMDAHLAHGGSIIAATHAPLGLNGRELTLGPAR